MHCVVDIGEEMLRSGAEVRRVEDSMERMFAAYGARRRPLPKYGQHGPRPPGRGAAGFQNTDQFHIPACFQAMNDLSDKPPHPNTSKAEFVLALLYHRAGQKQIFLRPR